VWGGEGWQQPRQLYDATHICIWLRATVFQLCLLVGACRSALSMKAAELDMTRGELERRTAMLRGLEADLEVGMTCACVGEGQYVSELNK
jgi:hypothetical protein